MPLQDRFEELALAQMCVAGDEGAWRVLITEYDEGVRRTLRRRLGNWGTDWWVVEDQAACFWEELWQRRVLRLRTYDPGRGGLAAYLNHLVRWQVLRFWQERGRREKEPLEERLLSRELLAPPDPCYPEGVFRDDVSTLLTPQERRYFAYLCAEAAADGSCPFSDTNRWKLHQHVRRKASGLLGLR